MRLWTLGLVALAAVLFVLGLLIAVYWRALVPPEPDWQTAVAAAVADDDCEGAAIFLAMAIDADVPDAFHRFDTLFFSDAGPCVGHDLDATRRSGWIVRSLPATQAELRERMTQAIAAQGDWPGPARRSVMLLQGLQPGFHNGDSYEYDPAFPGIALSTRLKLLWLVLKCDPVMSSHDGPDWYELETAMQPIDTRWREGAWTMHARDCANDVADLIDDIGIGATGPDGDLVADLLIYAPFTTQPRLAYLKAQRALDHKLAHKWSEPDPDGTRLRMQGLVDLYIAARAGHPEAMARIGRVALAGDLAPVMEDMSASDERVTAFVFLSLAQEARQDTQDDLTGAGTLLDEDERQRADETLEMWRADFAETGVAWAKGEVR